MIIITIIVIVIIIIIYVFYLFTFQKMGRLVPTKGHGLGPGMFLSLNTLWLHVLCLEVNINTVNRILFFERTPVENKRSNVYSGLCIMCE